MLIYDPTVQRAKRALRRAPAMASIEGKTIGILENGKLNATEMLGAIAALLVERHGCRIAGIYSKSNASAPAPKSIIDKAAKEVDILISGVGD